MGVMATPALAGAQAVDETTTTTAGATTTTVATTTTSTTTTTTPKPPATFPPPPEVLEVLAPGDTYTRSGRGCLIDGKAGTLYAAIGDERVTLTLPPVPARADGSWSFTFTVPATFVDGFGASAIVCGNETVAEPIPLDLYLFIIQKPGSPPITGTIDDEGRGATGRVQAKVNAPKSVKSSPKYTG